MIKMVFIPSLSESTDHKQCKWMLNESKSITLLTHLTDIQYKETLCLTP